MLRFSLIALTLGLSSAIALPAPLSAGTCVAGTSCGTPPLQVVPGYLVGIEVVNRTYIPVLVQHVGMTTPLSVASRQTVDVLQGSTVQPNFSLFFWTEDGGALQASVSQPYPQRLRIEIRASRARGNNAVYLKDDGRVEVL